MADGEVPAGRPPPSPAVPGDKKDCTTDDLVEADADERVGGKCCLHD